MLNRPNIGDRVLVPTPTGRALATVVAVHNPNGGTGDRRDVSVKFDGRDGTFMVWSRGLTPSEAAVLA